MQQHKSSELHHLKKELPVIGIHYGILQQSARNILKAENASWVPQKEAEVVKNGSSGEIPCKNHEDILHESNDTASMECLKKLQLVENARVGIMIYLNQ